MSDFKKKGTGRSRLAPPALRQDARVSQARRQQQGLAPFARVERPAATSARPTGIVKPQTGSERRAERRAAATKLQRAARIFLARNDLRKSIKGEVAPRLAALVGEHYEKAGLVRATKTPLAKQDGRLAGDWSGGVDTQKKHLTKLGTFDPIGTTHHTVSDNFLAFVDQGVKRLEAGNSSQKAAAGRFRSQVKKDSLYSGDNDERALFQVRQNLTFGPGSDFIKKDPGAGFDATFAPTGKPGLVRDWDQRSTAIRPVHNLGFVLKSGKYELTSAGADHATTAFANARTHHDADLAKAPVRYKTGDSVTHVPNPAWDPKRSVKGVSKTQKVVTPVFEDQTIPVHGVKSGHFEPTTLTRKGGASVPGFVKKTWQKL